MDFTKKIFSYKSYDTYDANVIIVSDFFVEDHLGGAELTTQAIIDSHEKSNIIKIYKIKSKDVTLDFIKQNIKKYWIFTNFFTINNKLIPIIKNMLTYSVIEYDYKFCKYRSLEKHEHIEKKECDCRLSENGQQIADLIKNANNIFWMSEGQRQIYENAFPEIKNNKNQFVISSIFSIDQLEIIKKHRKDDHIKNPGSCGLLIANAWIKGSDITLSWIRNNGYSPIIISGLAYDKALEKLSYCSDFAYMPKGNDTCPRMVIEAKLLGCKLHINEYVQHASEPWFNKEIDEIEQYLVDSHKIFWDKIKSDILNKKTISGYTQTLNCISQNYPWKESIASLLGFCDEVVVVDGGSSDGTWEELNDIQHKNEKLKIFQISRDWNSNNFALYDGMQKDAARKLCTGDFLWQSDVDEIVDESDYEKIRYIVNDFPKNAELLALPVVEYWGSHEKVRVDTNPWKWRLSRNSKNITHGIIKQDRAYDENGNLYSLGSDGCDYIYEDTHEKVKSLSFYTNEIEFLRRKVLEEPNNDILLKKYEDWYNKIVEKIPSVYHYSWYDIERKIISYKNFWEKFWGSLYKKNHENFLFEKSWDEITKKDIRDISIKMKNELGGHILDKKINFDNPTPWIKINKNSPAIMRKWTSLIDKKYEAEEDEQL